MMFGLNVENVLMLGQDVKNIQRLPIEEKGLCGAAKLQGRVVPVLDFAHRIGVPSGLDAKTALIQTLTQRENDHIEWLNALETAIKNSTAFTKATDPNQCAFGKWYNVFETRDETLKDLLEAFDEPHKTIHALAEELLDMRDHGNTDLALEKLQQQRQTTLRRLRALFERTREQINSAMRQVLLFVTTDGKTPLYALLIDDINDVITYEASEYEPSTAGSLSMLKQLGQVIDGIYVREGLADCLYFDIERVSVSDEMLAEVSQ
jgi:chemotaxis signal transduction protein